MVNLYVKKSGLQTALFCVLSLLEKPAEISLEYFSSIDDVYSLWQS